MLAFQTDYDENTGDQVLTCFLLPQLEGSCDEGTGSPSRGRLIRGAFADSEDLYRKDKDFGEDGGWFDGPDDHYPTAFENRQSIVKFSGDKDNEDENENANGKGNGNGNGNGNGEGRRGEEWRVERRGEERRGEERRGERRQGERTEIEKRRIET